MAASSSWGPLPIGNLPYLTPSDPSHPGVQTQEGVKSSSYTDDEDLEAAMNSDRTQAYGRIVKTLEDLGPAKLLATEQIRIRDAADTLIFASGADHDVMAAVEDVRALADHLVESDRWTEERAAKLVDDLGACGPLAPVA